MGGRPGFRRPAGPRLTPCQFTDPREESTVVRAAVLTGAGYAAAAMFVGAGVWLAIAGGVGRGGRVRRRVGLIGPAGWVGPPGVEGGSPAPRWWPAYGF